MFMGIFGAAQIRITNDAINAGLNGSSMDTTYGYLANQNNAQIGVFVETQCACPGYETAPIGVEVFCTCKEFEPRTVNDNTTRLWQLGTADVVFEHLSSYGGTGYTTFMTLLTLICIALYFVTSSDSASYVIDMMAANGIEEPPLLQKVYWCLTEGLAAIALLLSASDDTGAAAMNAVRPLPIVLGLPFTFVLFWIAQSALILCREESDENFSVNRKNFSTFIINWESQTLVSFVAPFIPFGVLAEKVWGSSKAAATIGFAVSWIAMIVLLVLMAVDYVAFSSMGCAMFFMNALLVAGLRASAREKLGITGDLISDCVTSCFAFPCALGQMAVQDFPKVKVALDEVSPDAVDNSTPVLLGMRSDEVPVTEQKV